MNKQPKENIQKELLDLGSSLSSKPKNEGFELPGDYFETFPQRVNQRITAKQQRQLLPGIVLAKGRLATVLTSVLVIFAIVFGLNFIRSVNNQGYFDQALFDEYFVFVYENDRSIIYEITAIDQPGFLNGTQTPEAQDDTEQQTIEYVLDMAEYYGLSTRELIAALD